MGLRMDDLHTPTVASGPTARATAHEHRPQQSLQEVITQKEKFEAELSALGEVLDSHHVDMNTPLTTTDGFPRADIDVAQIRTTRARIIHLKNDHKDVMKRLEDAILEQFAAGKPTEQRPVQTPGQTTTAAASVVDCPFARVKSVVPMSPAERAGMQAGDKVTKFGHVNWANHERLGKVAQVVQQNENHHILVRILRDSEEAAPQTHELQLTPRRDWGGRGLLGCHLVPL